MPYKVDNIVRKGEIACYKQLLFFSQCFPQFYIVCENAASTIQYQEKMTLENKALEYTFGKGENAGNQPFLLFPQSFVPYQ